MSEKTAIFAESSYRFDAIDDITSTDGNKISLKLHSGLNLLRDKLKSRTRSIRLANIVIFMYSEYVVV